MVEKWVRIAGDTVTVVVGVLLIVVLGLRLLGGDRPGIQQQQQQVVDVRLESDIGIDFAAASITLIMALQSDCGYCQESMPFYRRLLEHDTDDVQIVVAAPPGDSGIVAYLKSEGVTPDSVIFVELSRLPVSGTPTLVLTEGEGLVTHAWIGLLDAEREAELIDTLFG